MKKKASAAKSKPAAKPAPKAAAKKAVKTKAVKSPAFKLGDKVIVITSHGKTRRLGKVIGIVPAGKVPGVSLATKKLASLKQLGFNKMKKARAEKSYLVEADGALYWPKAECIMKA